MKKVIVTGAGGYIGTQLVNDLLRSGYEVKAIDRFFFGLDTVKDFIDSKHKFEYLKKDIRDLDEKDFKGFDAVFDLACLSNDPAGEIDPNLTYQINRDGRIHVAKTAKSAGVSRYVLSSSCSVYGSSENGDLTEESATNPISVYAKSTLQAEQENLSIADNNFSVSALRNATVFGLSRRMRFDLVVNLMVLTAFQKRRIIVMGGGLQWRPLVHVSDVSRAFITTLNSSQELINSQIFNVGLDNYQIRNLAYLVREELGFPIEIEVAPDDPDKRNYNVNFSKAKNKMNFEAKTSVIDGIKEIYSALKNGTVDTGPKTVTVGWYRNILEAKKLVSEIEINGRVI